MTTAAPSNTPSTDRATRLESKTRGFVLATSRGELTAATQDFGETMQRGLTPDVLGATWGKIEEGSGKFRSIERVSHRLTGALWSDEATCAFEHGRLVVQVTYDPSDAIVGVHVLPATEDAAAWTPPDYSKPDTLEDRKITVGTAHPLPGTLTLPKGHGPYAAIVLVHGSGPNDEDESIGGVKVFRDLATGLASRSIAVLRYAKRSKVDPAGIVTQKEEVLDAVHDAIDLARHTPEIDPARVFVLGHSQGGYLAPRIAKENPELAGVIIFAGSAQPLEDSVLDQLTYFSSLDAKAAQALAPQIEAARVAKGVIESPGLKPDDDVHILGATLKGAYFLDVRGYDPPAVARQLRCPILVLQGERDYQVTMKELARWRDALAARRDVSVKSYPSLNHLFVAGEGPPGPAEYAKPGHVDGAVIDDIATWILATSRSR